MDVYKGTGAFSGIAIGKILYYHKSEYQMRQYEITDVKTELNIFRQARTRVMEQLEDLYEKNCIIQGTQAEIFLRQKNLLEGKSFQRAIESVIHLFSQWKMIYRIQFALRIPVVQSHIQ